MELCPSDSRLEILRFMIACERFLIFVRSNGGPSALTLDESRRITAYQKMITTLISDEKTKPRATEGYMDAA